MRTFVLVLGLVALSLGAQDLSKLPPWAREAAAQSLKETPPPDADAWVLLQRQTFSYEGKGEVHRSTFRLVKILGQRGLVEGGFSIGAMGKASKVTSLKGWNLRPDGELAVLNRQDVAILDPDTAGEATTATITGAVLTRLAVGSLVAFQAEEGVHLPMGPVNNAWVMENIPVRRWECSTSVSSTWTGRKRQVEVRVEPRHLEAWGLTLAPLPEGGFAVNNVPATPKDEAGYPRLARILPHLELRFLDPELTEAPSSASWDLLASWYCLKCQPAFRPSGQLATTGLPPKEALAKIVAWMNRELIYKQMYLSPDRGWLPLACEEVVRRRSGDCKDHAACFLGEAAGAGFQGYPVWCAAGPAEVEADQPPSPYAFNHMIAAVRLKESLGFPAEVVTERGRFLLVDTTDRFCPLGRLPSGHRGRRVLICTNEGAIWAQVPPEAPLVPALTLKLQGEVRSGGATRAMVQVGETGNAQALRVTALYEGLTGLKEHALRHLLDLTPTDTLSEVHMGDPLDLGRAFEVTFTVDRAQGGTWNNGRGRLDPWGLPGPLGAVQKPGVPRVYPLEIRQSGILEYHAVWSLPGEVKPRLPVLDADTPFRTCHWKAAAQGQTLTLDLSMDLKDATFEGARREAGVSAWKKERRLLDQLNEEGPAFTFGTAPPPPK